MFSLYNEIKNKRTFIIAEVGQAHEGSLGLAHSFIDAVSETGVNAIKFQTHIAEYESSHLDNFELRINFFKTKIVTHIGKDDYIFSVARIKKTL